jgi:hypothetical protein
MTSAAIIATQLTDTTAYPYSLLLGSLEVIRPMAAGGNSYGVPVETIDLEEAGPGGVSSLSFTIEDPQGQVPIPTASLGVQMWDLTNNRPLFAGFVQNKKVRPYPPGGRYLDITCIGIEIVLDWMKVPGLTIPSGTDITAAVQSVLANATGIGVSLRAGASQANQGNQAFPIGDLSVISFGTTLGADVVLAGETVREGIRKCFEVAVANGGIFGVYGADFVGAYCTVDFWYGVRVWNTGNVPADYATLTITDTPAGAIAAANLAHETDDSGIVRAVVVKGGNAAGSGTVTDGSGLPGEVATLEDDTILTAVAMQVAGRAYLVDKATAERGSYTVQTFAPTTNIRAGSNTTITDAEVGLSAATYPIASIRKSFSDTLQTWEVAYGGLRPSFARFVRRATRGTRS